MRAEIPVYPRNIKTRKEAPSAASTLLPADRAVGSQRLYARVAYPECGSLTYSKENLGLEKKLQAAQLSHARDSGANASGSWN
jgi:hypothetical protein